MTITYTLHADDGGASDTTQLHLLEMFAGSVQPILSNPAHVLPASKAGVVSDYTGSGTRIEVYQGTNRLDYDGVGTANGHWKVTVANVADITEGTATSAGGTNGGRYANIGDHSGMSNSADFKTITYTITGKATDGTAFSFAQPQTITKSKTGQDGTAGQSVKHETIFRKNVSTIDDDVGTFASPLTGNSDWSLSMPALTANGDIAYASSRTFTSDGESPQDATWSTPIAALTRTNGTNATPLTITDTDTSVAGETTLTFSDGSTFTIDDGDNGDDGDGIDVIYQNSSTALTTAPADSAGAPTGWSFTASAPATGEKTYISIGVRTQNTGSYDWSVPSAITAFDGDNGAGVNFVFARSATKPNTPTANGLNIPSQDIQWYDDPPSGTTTLWSSKGTVGVNGTAYAWGAVFQVEGSAVAELKCYSDVVANNGASPTKPGTSTYNATNSTLTLNDTDWNLTPPSVTNNGDTVYSCTVLVSGSPNATAIAIGNGWSTPVIHTRKTDGAVGDPGKLVQELRLYKLQSTWTASGTTVANTAPTSGVYTFSTGALASIASGWSQTRPAVTGANFVIESAALATESSSGSDTSSALTWSTASISSEGVQFTNFIFLNHNGSPGTPTATAYPDLPTNNPNTGDNWSDSPPAAEAGKQLWSSKGVAKLAGSFPTFTFNYTWETPVVHVQSKADIALDQVTNDAQVKTDGSNAPNILKNDQVTLAKAANGTISLTNANAATISLDNADVGLGDVTNHAQIKSDGSNAPNILKNDQVTLAKAANGTISLTNANAATISLDNADVGLGDVTNHAQIKDDLSNLNVTSADLEVADVSGTKTLRAKDALKNAQITTNANGTLNYNGAAGAAPSLASIGGTVSRASGGFGINVDTLIGNAAKIPRWNGSAWVADTPTELRGNIGAGTSNFAGGWANLTGTIPTTVANSSISSSNVTGALGFTPGTSSFGGTWADLTGTIPSSVDNSATGNSNTLTITSGSAAYTNRTPTAQGSAVNTTPYTIFTGSDSQPTYGGLTHTVENRPKPFFVGAISTGGYSNITMQNFQITMSGLRRFYNTKSYANEGAVFAWVGAGISSSSTTYSEVSNGFIGWVNCISNISFAGNEANATNNIALLNTLELAVPDAAKSIGGSTRHLWLWLECYWSGLVQNDTNLAIGLADRTDSKIILERTSGAAETGTYAHSTSSASINT